MPQTRSTVLVLAGGMLLGGCATIRTHLRYGSLTSQAEMRESVFLEPRSDLPPTVYLTETCTADSQVSVRPSLDRELATAGYVLVDDPDSATYVIQINHVRLAETELSGDQTLGDAISGAFAAGVGAGVAADVLGASGDVAAGVGLTVGAVGFIMDAKTKHIAHLLTTDVLVTETVARPDTLADADASEGQPSVGAATLRQHTTQIVSGASKVNLRYGESLPVLVAATSHTLSHMLPVRTAGGG